MTEFDEQTRDADSAEAGALGDEGEGARQPGPMRSDPAEGGREDVLQTEQQGTGYGSDEGERDAALDDE